MINPLFVSILIYTNKTKVSKNKKTGTVVQVVGGLSSKCKALGSVPRSWFVSLLLW